MSAVRQTKQSIEKKDVVQPQRRLAPRDVKLRLHAVEGARKARVLDANTDAPRYICIGLAVIRI